ncbi:hypothetical protein WDZ92_46900, partial [Nostoc sp. NIES-2111]
MGTTFSLFSCAATISNTSSANISNPSGVDITRTLLLKGWSNSQYVHTLPIFKFFLYTTLSMPYPTPQNKAIPV